VENYSAHLSAAGIEIYHVKRDTAEQRDRPGIRVTTMHRVKGLEFEHVIVAGANRGIVPLDVALASGDDAVTQRNIETGERALLYVALTRAKRSALVTAPSQRLIGVLDIPELKLHCNFRGWQTGAHTRRYGL
jgi:superfamily I DNA/RNA helicase